MITKEKDLLINETVEYNGKKYIVIGKELYRGKWKYNLGQYAGAILSKHIVSRKQIKRCELFLVKVKDIKWEKKVDKFGLPLPKKFDICVIVAEDASVNKIDKEIEMQIERVYGVGYTIISYTTEVME